MQADRRLPRTLELEHVDCALCGSGDKQVVVHGRDFEYDTATNEFTFVRCRDCDHLYLDPRPKPDDLDVIYPPDYYSFAPPPTGVVAAAQRRWEAGKVRLYREYVGDGEKRLLDVGCGEGRFLRLLRDFGDPGWRPVGLEFDPEIVGRLRAQGFEAFAARVEDFADDPEQRGRYDCVIMLQLIEHVEDPALIAERVFELLRPGGVFVIETPEIAGLDYALFGKRHWGHYHFPRHWNLFTEASLRKLLSSRGFEIVSSESLISTSAWIVSLHNRFIDRGWPAFVYRFFSYKNPLLLGLFVVLDTLRVKLGRKTSNQRIIARKPASDAGRG